MERQQSRLEGNDKPMDIYTATAIKNQMLKQLEEKLERKLTEGEMEVFYATSNMALLKGERYGRCN